MSLVYQLMYLVGLRPWERGGIPAELAELVEGPGALAAGKALDIGCGTGAPAVYLAAHGWDVTGIDVVERALRAARARAAAAGVSPRFLRGDVSRLAELPAVGGGFGLLFDAGCFHGLDGPQRASFAKAIAQVAAPDAVLLMFALAPGGGARPAAWRGASDEEIRAPFGAEWDLVEKRPDRGPSVLRGAARHWYRLRRRPPG